MVARTGCYSQTWTSHTPDDNTLVVLVAFHVAVAIVCNGKNMWWQFPNLFVSVSINLFCGVDIQDLIGIHSHKN